MKKRVDLIESTPFIGKQRGTYMNPVSSFGSSMMKMVDIEDLSDETVTYDTMSPVIK